MFRLGATPAHAGMTPPPVKLAAPPRPKKSTNEQPRKAARLRGNNRLVIVESPAKAKTVGKFLGSTYRVRASVGHVRDLLRSQLAVDVENDFAPRYRVPKEKMQVVKELQSEVKNAAEVFLATDPDREGEAIAWHLMEAAKINEDQARRVVFHEITRDAIEEAFRHPRTINMQLVNAQQARRILDRLVGYKISPILWNKVRSRLSAGRVQSVALRLVVEREREIMAFVPVEYWSIEAELAKQTRPISSHKRGEQGEGQRQSFIAKLFRMNGQEVDLKHEADTLKIIDDLENATYTVLRVDQRERKRNPSAPFTTSTLQQEASRRLGFTAKRTMGVAQGLYEGVDVGPEGTVGLITYMRTDSTNVAPVAQQEAREFIGGQYGEQFRPPQPPVYKTRTKGAQEAHEAIRPTSVFRTPEALKPYLERDQHRLYEIIWKRFVASQMAAAIMDVTTVDIDARPQAGIAVQLPSPPQPQYLFRATGSVIKFPGFLVLYEEAREEGESAEEGEGKILPPLTVDEVLDLRRLIPEQHFTQPPPRYSEATLVKALEEYGIGRPSTYAPIISTIQQRGYVERIDRRLYPTELGCTVNDLLVAHFPDIVDVGFTAQMESNLDRIAAGDQEWVPVLRDFYNPFAEMVARAEANMPKVEMAPEHTGERCEKCGSPMLVKFGRFGKFVACSKFPECRNTKSFQVKIGAFCPECGGDIVEKKTRRKRVFYGCANYPACNFATWQKPLVPPCPVCGGLLTQASKDTAKCVKCGEIVPVEALEAAQLVGV